MTFKNDVNFTYDGESSTNYKIVNVSYSTSPQEEFFLPSQEIYSEYIPNKPDPYFKGIKRLPLQLELEFAFEENFTETEEIAGESVGTGDDSETEFYLDYYPSIEANDVVVKLDDVATTAYTLDWNIRKITFDVAPGLDVVITANYTRIPWADAVAMWLSPEDDEYKELIFSDNTNAVYFARYEGDINLLHNCNDQGLITLVMRCSSPYIYSTLNESDIYTASSTITFYNTGHMILYPIINLSINNSTSFTLRNETNSSALQLTGLSTGDVIIIDCENEIVTATNSGVTSTIYRYDNVVNGEYLYMDVGENSLSVSEETDWEMNFEYRVKWLKV
ncbi:MAG: hypothetical protein WDA59_08510 [Methanofastidiosum sp.]